MARSRWASRSRAVCSAAAVRESIEVCRPCSIASRWAPRRSSRRIRSGRSSAACSSASASVRCSRRGKDAARRTSGRARCRRARSTRPTRALASAASTAASAPDPTGPGGPLSQLRQCRGRGPRVATEEQLGLQPQQGCSHGPRRFGCPGEPALGACCVPAGIGVLVPQEGKPGPLEVGLGDVVGDAACPRSLLALLEGLQGLVDEADLGESAGLVEVTRRRERAVRQVGGLGHQRQRLWQVAEEHLQPAAIVHRRHGEVGEAVRQCVLVCPAQAHVTVVVATQELVGQTEVEVQQAPGPRGDVSASSRHALEQLARSLPLTDPPVQPGPLHHDQRPHVVRAARRPRSASATSRSANAPSGRLAARGRRPG